MFLEVFFFTEACTWCHIPLQNANVTKHKLCLNLNKCLKNQKLKLIISNRIRSAWQQEMNRSVISIEEGMNSRQSKNSIGQEVSIHTPLRSQILPQRLKGIVYQNETSCWNKNQYNKMKNSQCYLQLECQRRSENQWIIVSVQLKR